MRDATHTDPGKSSPRLVLETGRLRLRHATETDAAFILVLLNEPSFIENIGDRGVRSVSEARRYIVDRIEQSHERHGFGMFVVERSDDGALIGVCGLVQRDSLAVPDIGFAFLPQYWSRGYALESAGEIVRHARFELGIRQICAIVTPTNAASIRVIERLGLVRAGRARLFVGNDVDVFAEPQREGGFECPE